MTTGYTPIYRIMKGDVDVTDRFNDRTTDIKVVLQSGGGDGDQCVIKVDDRDWKIARPVVGDVIEVWLGYQEVGLAYMGQFSIDDVTFLGMPRSIQLTGNSTGMKTIMKAPRIREFANPTVGSILSQIAGEAGLGVAIAGALGSAQLPFKNQLVSNNHIVHELERIFGAVAKVVDGKLLFVPRDGTETASGIPVPTLVLQKEHFGSWMVRYNDRNDVDGVQASYHDPVDHVRKWVNAGPLGAIAEGFGEFKNGFPIGPTFASRAEAEAAAKSRMESFNRASVFATFDLAKGDPWIRDMQTLIVEGMRDGINGSYVIDKATHTYIKSTGIRSALECRAPGDGADYSNRATKEFLNPLPGELLGEFLRKYNGFKPESFEEIPVPALP